MDHGMIKQAYAEGAYAALVEAGYQEKVAWDIAVKMAAGPGRIMDMVQDVMRSRAGKETILPGAGTFTRFPAVRTTLRSMKENPNLAKNPRALEDVVTTNYLRKGPQTGIGNQGANLTDIVSAAREGDFEAVRMLEDLRGPNGVNEFLS